MNKSPFAAAALALASLMITGVAPKVSALPGDTIDAVSAWIAAHPTLGPTPGDTLWVKKNDTAARSFTFRASTSIPRGLANKSRIIRSEEMNFFDVINGVTPQRLSESLRVVYGPAVYDDYFNSEVVCAYPSREMVDTSVSQNLELTRAIRGQVREGNNFAYWLEVIPTASGMAYNGSITLFMLDDLEEVLGRLGKCEA